MLRSDHLIDDWYDPREAIKSKIFVKTIYQCNICSDLAISLSASKWQKLLPEVFDHEVHKSAFTNIYRLTKVTKLRNFQYRLLHNVVFCNDRLFYYKKVPLQQCEWCEYPKQNIVHLLVNCKRSQEIWGYLKEYLHKSGLNVEFSLQNVIYNNVKLQTTHVVNLVTLITKFYIYKCKVQGKIPNAIRLAKEIELQYNIEVYNANEDDRVEQILEKWSLVYPVY